MSNKLNAIRVRIVNDRKSIPSDNQEQHLRWQDRIALLEEVDRLTALINCPHNDDWFDGVRIEAAHQQERWGTSHDAGKQPSDWFWLVGYLAGKCLMACVAGDQFKARHHTISTAAVLLNWWRAISGQNTRMRPGIADPDQKHCDPMPHDSVDGGVPKSPTPKSE